MLNFKRLLSVLIVPVLTISLAGCASNNKATSEKGKQTVTVGLMPTMDSIPFVIAQEKGYFKKQGVDVKLQIFKSANDRDAAFQSGALDGISTDQVSVSLYQNGGTDLKITSVTEGDFFLIAGKNSGIKSINDVKGKSIAISENTVVEYTLDRMLQKSGIDPKEIKKTAIPAIPVRLEMLNSGKVDLGLLPEPFSTFALKDGGILLGKVSEYGLSPTVFAFTADNINGKKDEIKAFYKAYNEAAEYINNTPVSEYEDIVIKTVGYPEGMKGSIPMPKYRINTLPTEQQVKDAVDWGVEKGIIKNGLSAKDMLSDAAQDK